MSEDQVKDKLKQGLLKKIKETYHIKKDYKEALSYVNYYISNIGSNDEILLYKNKIEKKLTSEIDPVVPEEKKSEPLQSEDSGIPEPDIKTSIKPESKPPDDQPDEQLLGSEFLVDDQEKISAQQKKEEERKEVKDLFLLDPDQLVKNAEKAESKEELPAFDTFDDMFELEKKDMKKGEPAAESEPATEIEKSDDEDDIFNIENNQLTEAENGLDLELDFDNKEEPNILDLDKEIVISPKDKDMGEEKAEEKVEEKEESEIEVVSTKANEIDPLDKEVDKEDAFSFDSPQISTLDEEIVEIQTDTPDEIEPEEELSLSDEEKPVVTEEEDLFSSSLPRDDQPLISPMEPATGIGKILQNFSKQQIMIGGGVLVVLIAVILYFLLSGNGDITESITPRTKPVKKEKPAAQKLVDTAKPQTPIKKSDPINENFKKYLSLAEEYFTKGDYEKSQQNIELAKKIKTNARLIQLENQIKKKIEEKKIKQLLETPQHLKKVETEVNEEERAFRRIASSNDISVLENYLKKYPLGKFSLDVKKRISELQKKERESMETQIRSDARLYKKVNLRTEFRYLSQQNIKVILSKAKQLKNRYEAKTLDGEKVIVDYMTGLMWHFWEEPMEFSKAKWWSARRYAGYHDWRLPTADEVSSLLNISSRYFPPRINAARFEIWSGDFNNTDSSRLWVFIYSKKTFIPIDSYHYKYLCSVRSIIR